MQRISFQRSSRLVSQVQLEALQLQFRNELEETNVWIPVHSSNTERPTWDAQALWHAKLTMEQREQEACIEGSVTQNSRLWQHDIRAWPLWLYRRRKHGTVLGMLCSCCCETVGPPSTSARLILRKKDIPYLALRSRTAAPHFEWPIDLTHGIRD